MRYNSDQVKLNNFKTTNKKKRKKQIEPNQKIFY